MTVTVQTLGPGIASQTTTVLNPTGVPAATGPTFGGGSSAPTPVTSGPTFGGGSSAPNTGPTFGGGGPDVVSTPVLIPAVTVFQQQVAAQGTTVVDGTNIHAAVLRDTTGLSGGTRGYMNVAAYAHSITGKDVKAFETAALAVLDNFADEGENVAMYAQGNKHGKGPTWAACFEACNTNEDDHKGLLAAEADVWCTGPDTGQRMGVDVFVGDANFIRSGTRRQADATTGVRVGACGLTPWATWRNGYQAANFTWCGLHLNSKAVRGIHLEGEYIVGVDLSTAKMQSAVRLAEGQRITFDQFDWISLSNNNGRISIKAGATPLFEIDTTTGDIYKRGVKVL